jgi:plasmid stabilization system protein ParE
MIEKVAKVVWTRQARKSLNEILDYRYKDIPEARKIVRKDIITTSKEIVFTKQFQQDEVYPQYRRIIVRDYKILYKEDINYVYIMNVICTVATLK